jgi:hypothetical protein
MKRYVLAAILSLFLSTGASAAPPADVAVQLLDGGAFSLDEYRGEKPVLLQFRAISAALLVTDSTPVEPERQSA